MDAKEIKYARLRDEMVRRQVEARGISDPRVLEVMRQVPRHRFVSEALMDRAYGDFPLPIGEKQTISQPFIVAEMTQALSLTGSERVLELGTGSGYQAAVLSRLVYRVYTIERIHTLYARARRAFDDLRYFNIVSRFSDGTTGWPEEGPFDAIIVTAGGPEVPVHLTDQLTDGGRLVMPVGGVDTQDLLRITRAGDELIKENMGKCRFVPLIGEHGWKE
ncbi:MAG: protein-L-isoaspartate(D-aspartate) O-methyltransferase [Desulfobacterales bacterium]|nr:protein-L-isoaspartate(D-aspartate) O-methyltransferase [Desulfobacterales bacterium]